MNKFIRDMLKSLMYVIVLYVIFVKILDIPTSLAAFTLAAIAISIKF